jgi:hypothetical protein
MDSAALEDWLSSNYIWLSCVAGAILLLFLIMVGFIFVYTCQQACGANCRECCSELCSKDPDYQELPSDASNEVESENPSAKKRRL